MSKTVKSTTPAPAAVPTSKEYKLQILVPHYNEPFEVMKPLLDSIAIQQNINLAEDVSVIIVNDGDEYIIDKANFTSYPFDIYYYHNSHQGVSATRNFALDKATAPYVMFCDCDDMFGSVCALWVIFREIASRPFDVLLSVFMQETYNAQTKEITYLNRGDKNVDGLDSVFIHGKVYSRQYLIDNNIRFNPVLTIHEDSYFNCLATTLTTNSRYISQPFYIWRWRADSVCRSDPKYILKTYSNLIASSNATVEQFILRGKLDNAKFNVCYMIFNAYYTFNLPDWLAPENQDLVLKVVPYIKNYYLKYKYLLDDTTPTFRNQAISKARSNIAARGLVLESITFNDWISKVLAFDQLES